MRRAELAARASSFSGATSTATIVSAPASRAPCTTARPTPPQPMTATDAARLHRRRPERRARARSRSRTRAGTPARAGSASGILTAARLVHDDAVGDTPRSAAPARAANRRAGTSGCEFGGCSSSGARSPRRHARHASPHGARQAITTRSPGATVVTSSPTSSTTPAPSCPRRIGNLIPQPSVSTTCRSV